MKKIILLFSASLLFWTCQQKQSAISKEFNCETPNFKNLELVNDVQNSFSIQIPKEWNTNLYKDNIQSSIFTADTIKQLTETFLMDVSFVQKEIEFNDIFKLNIEQDNLNEKLIQKKSNEILFLDKPSYFSVSKGKKGKFFYQKLQVYTKVSSKNFVLSNIEIYGDLLVNQRFCKAIKLLETIIIHQEND